MIRRTLDVFDWLLRGYGQLFVVNRPSVGALYLFALVLVAPAWGALSLAAALLMTAIAAWFGNTSTVRSGLYGVNGVLLGAIWSDMPEVPVFTRWVMTITGAMGLVGLIAVATHWLKRYGAGLTMFSLPYVIVAWLGLIGLGIGGWYEPGLRAGFRALSAGKLATAAACFQAIESSHAATHARRDDGLGWVSFRQADYSAAGKLFSAASVADPTWADPLDGLGWSLYRQGSYEAAYQTFLRAVANDAQLADSYVGLAWLARGVGATDEAARRFQQAIVAAPLCADAYAGLAELDAANDNLAAAESTHRLADFIRAVVPSSYQFTRSTTLLAWALFAAGIAWHSRWSALMVGVGLLSGWTTAHFSYDDPRTVLDINWLMNLAAISVALGGQFLRPGLGSTMVTAVTCVVVTMAWHGLEMGAETVGVPLLCAPFNGVLLATLLLMGAAQPAGRWARRFAQWRVPLEIAITSPTDVAVWARKHDLAEDCWRQIRRARDLRGRSQ